MRKLIDKVLADRGFEETLVLMCLTLAIGVVSLAAMVRLLSHDWINAAFDAAVLVVTIGLAIYTWRSRNAALAGWLTALYCLAVVVAVSYLFGARMLFWAYPGTILVFFLLPRSITALRLNLLAIVVIVPPAIELGPWPEVATFLITLLTTNFLAMTFALHMHRSRARLRLMAERDALTGARNRYALEPLLRVALDRVSEHELPASLMMVDLDHFKQVNDTYGHGVGDKALRRVTQALINATRAGDDVFRYGGEELVVLANGAPGEPAGDLAEKLRQQVEEMRFDEFGGLTVSIGVSEAIRGETPQSWFSRADEFMYQAKNAGRNRVVVEGEEVVQQHLRFDFAREDG